MKYLYLFITFCYSFYCQAQLYDDFSDGELNLNPTWSGDIGHFCLDDGLLDLCADTAGRSLLYSALELATFSELEWSFDLSLDFSPSNNNYVEIVLFSSDSIVDSNSEIYYLRIGENGSNDAIELYHFDPSINENVLICRGAESALSSSFEKHFRVQYQNAEWRIKSRDLDSPYFINETNAFYSINLTDSGYFIIDLTYTASNTDGIFFDTIYAGEFIVDQQAASIDSLGVENEIQLSLYLSEAVDSSALDLSNYLLIPALISPISVEFVNSLQNNLHLSFAEEFVPWDMNELHIEFLQDLEENVVSELIVEFVFSPIYVASYGELRFSEILADPSPQLALPEAEYIELINVSDSIIQVKDYRLKNSGNEMDLKGFRLYPDSFLILCKETDTLLFEQYRPVMGISNWQNLLNTNDSLELVNSKGELLDLVYYDEDWYDDPLKKEGGWSLERINYSSPCLGKVNWRESINVHGGSPGRINSISDVEIENEILFKQAFLEDENELIIQYEGELDSTKWNELLLVSESEMNFEWSSIMADISTMRIYFSPSFQYGEQRQVIIKNMYSCDGDTLPDIEICLGIPELAEKGDIVINEILFNAFSGAHDFIEIYNKSQKFIDLKNWRIVKLWEDIAIEDARIIDRSLIIAPGKWMAFSEEPHELPVIYQLANPSYLFEVMDLPNFSDNDGQVQLLDHSLVIIDSIYYSKEMHYSLLEDENGVSLERIHPSKASLEEGTWVSASERVGFATPGASNSHLINPFYGAGVYLEPHVISPNNDGFNDFLILHYELAGGGWYGNMDIYNDRGSLVSKVFTNYWMESKGELIWEGLSSENEKLGLGIYIVLLELFNENGDSHLYKEAFVIE